MKAAIRSVDYDFSAAGDVSIPQFKMAKKMDISTFICIPDMMSPAFCLSLMFNFLS